jgi:hypothetical protein
MKFEPDGTAYVLGEPHDLMERTAIAYVRRSVDLPVHVGSLAVTVENWVKRDPEELDEIESVDLIAGIGVVSRTESLRLHRPAALRFLVFMAKNENVPHEHRETALNALLDYGLYHADYLDQKIAKNLEMTDTGEKQIPGDA